MRTIRKNTPSRSLSKVHENPPLTSKEATNAWKRFRKHKPDCVRVCCDEQYGLCGYSEVSLDNLHPILDINDIELSRELGSHIEHIEPKSKNPRRTFDHFNLILSAIDDSKARNLLKKDVFGGHHKQKMYSPNSFISPLNLNSEDYFHYETSGKVVPKESLPNKREKAKARLTIYILNLNAPILINWRKNWLTSLEIIINELDGNDLYQFAVAELTPSNNTLRPFHTAQKQIFGNLGTRVCTLHNI